MWVGVITKQIQSINFSSFYFYVAGINTVASREGIYLYSG